jgi:hypothetical protein
MMGRLNPKPVALCVDAIIINVVEEFQAGEEDA